MFVSLIGVGMPNSRNTLPSRIYSLLLHHRRCFRDIWYGCTRESRRRAVGITDGRPVKRYSGDILHKQIIALSLFARPLAAAVV